MECALAPQKCAAAANDLEPEIDYSRRSSEVRTVKLSAEEFEQRLNSIPGAEKLRDVRCSLGQRRPMFDFYNMAAKAAANKRKK